MGQGGEGTWLEPRLCPGRGYMGAGTFCQECGVYPLHDRLHFLSMVQSERQYEGWPDRRDTPIRRSYTRSNNPDPQGSEPGPAPPLGKSLNLFEPPFFFICKIGVRSIIAPA